MRCRNCGHLAAQTFSGEIAIHFPGLEGLKMPIVWVFPNVLICLHCAFAEFSVPDDPMKELRKPEADEGGDGGSRLNY